MIIHRYNWHFDIHRKCSCKFLSFICSFIPKIKMPSGKVLNELEKREISILKDISNLSNVKIANTIGRSETVVRNFLKNRVEYGKKRHDGRPPKVSAHQKRLLLRTASNSLKSAGEMKEELGLDITDRHVRRLLSGSNRLRSERRARKPMLSAANISARKQFAISHMSWTKEWRRVIFSDEKKFNLDGPDGFNRYWHDLRKEALIFSKRQCGGGSVMVWGAIGYNKKPELIFISEKLNAVGYQEMVGPLFPAWGYEMAGLGWKFQQDNAPIHKAKSTMKCFEEKKIPLFQPWPAKSPDLNIIENVWSILAREVYKHGRQYANKAELTDAIKSCWKNIDHDKIKGLYESLPRRMEALYRAEGKHTKY